MHASLIFCSTSASINVQKIFKIVLAKAFDLKCVIPEIDNIGEPILLYVSLPPMSLFPSCNPSSFRSKCDGSQDLFLFPSIPLHCAVFCPLFRKSNPKSAHLSSFCGCDQFYIIPTVEYFVSHPLDTL